MSALEVCVPSSIESTGPFTSSQAGGPIERVLAALGGGRRSGQNWTARCPAHADDTPSLSVSLGRDGQKVVLHCFAGCEIKDIVGSAGLLMTDLFPAKELSARRREVAVYDYVDEVGQLLFQVVRYDDKTFPQRRPDGRGGWIWSLGQTRRVLYRLPEVMEGVKAGRPVHVVEGEKDVDKMFRAGHVATCNPGGAGKWSIVARQACSVLAGATVIVVADKDDAGRKHAMEVAASLAPTCASVTTVEAKSGKDSSDHLAAGHGVEEFVRIVPDTTARIGSPVAGERDNERANDPDDKKTTVATTLVNLALDRYRLVALADGEAMAVPVDGPLLAKPLRGTGGLRATLAAAYFATTRRAASSSALTDALAVLEGQALEQERETASLRVATHEGSIVIDLGCAGGEFIIIRPDDYTLCSGPGASPVLFRRTALTGALPLPEILSDANPLDSLNLLRDLVNVTDRDWPVVVGYLVAALFADIPHPILLLGGTQGVGKSTAATMLAGLIDPSPAPLRSVPRDNESWAVSAAASWIIALDNLSDVSSWLSDALCRAVTGDGDIRRRLYTDGDLTVFAYRRVIMLTSIDPGSIRGDLAERLVSVDLEGITPASRRTDSDVQADYINAKPRILSGLYQLTSQVLAALPEIELDGLPRMADFAKILAAVDHVTGWKSLPTYLMASENMAAALVEDDPIARGVVDLLGRRGGVWTGTASDLVGALKLPGTPQAMTGGLTRIEASLRSVGIIIDRDRTSGRRRIILRRAGCDG